MSSHTAGPEETGGGTYWGRFNVVNALLMEAESARADGDTNRFGNLTSSAMQYVLEQVRRSEVLASYYTRYTHP